jgi:hypothetical protein
VAGHAGLENFLAASRGIHRTKAASREIQSADKKQQRPKCNLMENGFLNLAHAQPQRR